MLDLTTNTKDQFLRISFSYRNDSKFTMKVGKDNKDSLTKFNIIILRQHRIRFQLHLTSLKTIRLAHDLYESHITSCPTKRLAFNLYKES